MKKPIVINLANSRVHDTINFVNYGINDSYGNSLATNYIMWDEIYLSSFDATIISPKGSTVGNAIITEDSRFDISSYLTAGYGYYTVKIRQRGNGDKFSGKWFTCKYAYYNTNETITNNQITFENYNTNVYSTINLVKYLNRHSKLEVNVGSKENPLYKTIDFTSNNDLDSILLEYDLHDTTFKILAYVDELNEVVYYNTTDSLVYEFEAKKLNVYYFSNNNKVFYTNSSFSDDLYKPEIYNNILVKMSKTTSEDGLFTRYESITRNSTSYIIVRLKNYSNGAYVTGINYNSSDIRYYSDQNEDTVTLDGIVVKRDEDLLTQLNELLPLDGNKSYYYDEDNYKKLSDKSYSLADYKVEYVYINDTNYYVYLDLIESATVTFNMNYENSLNEDVVLGHGDKLEILKPQREGYLFGGWYTNSSCTDEFNYGSSISNDTTLYAKWVEIGFNNVLYEGQKSDLLYCPRDLYSSNFQHYLFVPSASGTIRISTSSASNSHLYILDSSKTNILSQNSNSVGDTFIDMNVTAGTSYYVVPCGFDSITAYSLILSDVKVSDTYTSFGDVIKVSYNNYVYKYLSTPIKTGYTFKNWVDNDGNEYSSPYLFNLTNDLVLHPLWTANKYTITLHDIDSENNYSPNSSTKIEVEYDSQYIIPSPKRENYDFRFWYDSDLNYFSRFSTVKFTENQDLTASWLPKTYEITLDSAGGEIDSMDDVCNFTNDDINPWIYNEQYNWYESSISSGNNHSNISYQALENCIITFNVSLSAHDNSDTVKIYLNSPLNEPTYIISGGESQSCRFEIAKDYGIYIQYEQHEVVQDNLSKCCIFDIVIKPQTLAEKNVLETNIENNLVLPTASRFGYTFDGWYEDTDTNCENKITEVNNATRNMKLIAKWTITEYTLTLQGINEEGVYDESSSCIKKIKYGDSYELPILTREGYTFVGWYLATDTTYEHKFESIQNMSYDMTLVARWAGPVNLTISGIDSDGIYDELNSYTDVLNYGDSYELPTPTRVAYNFVKWVDQNGDDFSLEKITYTKDVTIHPVWEAIAYNVTLNANGGVIREENEDGYSYINDSAYSWNVSNGMIQSNNKDDGSSSTFKYEFTKDGVFAFLLQASTEKNYDFGKVYKNSNESESSALYSVSGTETANCSIDVKAGDIIFIVYSKDRSQSSNNDNITISNITFSLEIDIKNYCMTINDTFESLPTPIKLGATFNGWYDENGTQYTSLSEISADIELHAEWTD